MRAFAPGIYPRSEALVQATRDLDRGRTSPEAVAQGRGSTEPEPEAGEPEAEAA